MKQNILKTVILTAGVIALYQYELIEKQTSVALIAFILRYFFGLRNDATKRVFKRDKRTESKPSYKY